MDEKGMKFEVYSDEGPEHDTSEEETDEDDEDDEDDRDEAIESGEKKDDIS